MTTDLPSGNPDFPELHKTLAGFGLTRTKGAIMGKGDKQKGNKEAKKPKAEKPKVSATANSMAGKDKVTLGAKKDR